MAHTPVICFDMDGTLNSFYSVPNWLDCLIANDPAPYRVAKPALRMNKLARQLNALQRKGAKLVVISWLSKNSNESFDNAVTEEKLRWLKKHLSSVAWDEIFIVPYGTNKATCCGVDNDVCAVIERSYKVRCSECAVNNEWDLVLVSDLCNCLNIYNI